MVPKAGFPLGVAGVARGRRSGLSPAHREYREFGRSSAAPAQCRQFDLMRLIGGTRRGVAHRRLRELGQCAFFPTLSAAASLAWSSGDSVVLETTFPVVASTCTSAMALECGMAMSKDQI